MVRALRHVTGPQEVGGVLLYELEVPPTHTHKMLAGHHQDDMNHLG